MVLGKTTLVLETKPLGRANKLRKDVERACAGMVRYLSRTEQDGAELARQAMGERPRDEEPSAPPEVRAAVLEMKKRQFERWCDLSIPALGGLTPRAAAASPSTRSAASSA